MAAEYISKVYERIDARRASSLMVPTTIRFQQDVAFGILCEFEYDIEHGLAIILFPEDKEEAGMQNIFI